LELIAIRVLVLLFSVVVHEVAHGWAAYRLGDPTAYERGRLTLNPLPHIDPVGSIIVPALLAMTGTIMFGWAKPVPVHVGRLNHPDNDHPKVAAAGPLSNLLLGVVFAVLLGLTIRFWGVPAAAHGAPTLGRFLFTMFQFGIMVNVVLALFNLLPLPPLDGSWIFSRLLPPEARARYENLRRYGMLIVVGFMLLLRYTGLGHVMYSGINTVATPYFSLALGVAKVLGA
jgi:Zn-dependent protease